MANDLAVPPSAHAPVETDLAVSVVVPVRNCWSDVRELLAALAVQTISRDRFEIVIADDGSERVPDGVATDDGWIRVTSGPPLGSYAARNRAAALARAPVLAFCDADCRPEPGWLEAGLRALEHADVAGGRIRFIVPERPTVWTLLDIELYLDQESVVRDGKAVTANLFVRRGAFERTGGFDTSLPSGGDMAMVLGSVARGATLVYEPNAVVWHPTRDRARSFLRKMWRVGRSYGARRTRKGRRPRLFTLRSLVPLAGPLRSRRRAGRPLRLDRARLEMHGVDVRFSKEIQALVLLYLLLPYVRIAAQFQGWRDARR
jgi:glycosyltransferase involved in cell wall biosynthesis